MLFIILRKIFNLPYKRYSNKVKQNIKSLFFFFYFVLKLKHECSIKRVLFNNLKKKHKYKRSCVYIRNNIVRKYTTINNKYYHLDNNSTMNDVLIDEIIPISSTYYLELLDNKYYYETLTNKYVFDELKERYISKYYVFFNNEGLNSSDYKHYNWIDENHFFFFNKITKDHNYFYIVGYDQNTITLNSKKYICYSMYTVNHLSFLMYGDFFCTKRVGLHCHNLFTYNIRNEPNYYNKVSDFIDNDLNQDICKYLPNIKEAIIKLNKYEFFNDILGDKS